jgi:hypothetical protein
MRTATGEFAETHILDSMIVRVGAQASASHAVMPYIM